MKDWKFLIYVIYIFAAIFAIGYKWCEWYVAGVFIINLIKFMICTHPTNKK